MATPEIIVETAAEKLKRIGKTSVVSAATANGNVPLLAVAYPSDTYKKNERYSITQEDPVDSGQGYQFTNLSNTEV